MKKITLVCCVLVVIAALLISSRWATAVDAPSPDTLPVADTSLAVALSVQDMVNQSDVIAIGNCLETRTVWVDRTLVTLATVSISESLKGSESSTITVTLPGGVDANRKIPIAMTYPGAPQITPGENVFLFLTATGEVAGSYTVAGFSHENSPSSPMKMGRRWSLAICDRLRSRAITESVVAKTARFRSTR